MAIAYLTKILSSGLGSTGGTTGTVDTTGATLLIASVGQTWKFTDPVFSDSEGNTWNRLELLRDSNVRLDWYYCIEPTTSAAHTFTSTSGSGGYPRISVTAYSSDSTPVFDEYSSSIAGINQSTSQPGAITPTKDDALVVCTVAHQDTGSATIDSSFVERHDGVYAASSDGGTYVADIFQTTAAIVNPTVTGVDAVRRCTAIAAFVEADIEVKPLVIIDGIRQQLPEVGYVLEDSVLASETLTPDGVLIRADGTTNRVQASTAMVSDTGALTLNQMSSAEASGSHTPIFIISDSTGATVVEISSHTVASNNLGMGLNSLSNVTTGVQNSSFGVGTLTNVTSGIQNFGLGFNAAKGCTTGSRNLAIGSTALFALSTGQENSAIGTAALNALPSGNFNTGLGSRAGEALTSGSNNTFVGGYAGQSVSQAATVSDSMCFGYLTHTTKDNQCVLGLGTITETVLQSHVILENKSSFETSGAHTSAFTIEDSSGSPCFEITSFLASTRNLMLGVDSGSAVTTGTDNVCVGTNAGQAVTDGIRNTCIGNDAGSSITSGDDCVFIGGSSGNDVTGSFNVCVGVLAGFSLTSGTSNTFIGYTAGHTGQTGTVVNSIGIGVGVVTTKSNQIIIGNSTNDETLLQANVGIGMTVSPETQLHVQSDSSSAARGLTIAQHNTGAQGALIGVKKSRGTGASPSAAVDGDFVGLFGCLIHDGTSYQQSGAFSFRVDGAVSAGTTPSRIDFITTATANGSPSGFGTSRMSVRADGRVVINESADASADFRVEGNTLTHMIYTDATAATENVALLTTSSPNWQSMDRGLFIGDATTSPTGDPTSGGFLYSNSGVLTWRESTGTTHKLGRVNRTSKTADYTVVDETLVLVDASSAAVTITLPAAANLVDTPVHVKKIDNSGNAVTIDGNGTETIDGQLTAVMAAQYTTLTVVSDGSNWHII